ncbi:MAG: glycosyltransferase family 2 protein [Phycisphaerae bacterium]
MFWLTMILLWLVIAAALFWLAVYYTPSQRRLGAFVYNSADDPAKFGPVWPGDPTPGTYAGDPESWPEVTVVVAGRNEARHLPVTLRSLCQMDYPHYRVVFVDDQSEDNSAAVLAELGKEFPHLQVIHNQTPPPAGWVGKCWALHQARGQITAPWVMFTDADLEFHPDCLRQMLQLAWHRQLDVLSSLPFVRVGSWGERLGILMGLLLISLKYPLARCNQPGHPDTITAGGFMLWRREAYEALGGHAAVKGRVTEDLHIGQRARALGLHVFTVLTHDLYGGTMYEGTRDTYHGLKKNAYAGAEYRPLVALLAVVILLVPMGLMPVYVVAAVGLWTVLPSLYTGLLMVATVVALLGMLESTRRLVEILGWRPRTAWLLPLAAWFYVLVLAGSMRDYYRGGNVWAGRRLKPTS